MIVSINKKHNLSFSLNDSIDRLLSLANGTHWPFQSNQRTKRCLLKPSGVGTFWPYVIIKSFNLCCKKLKKWRQEAVYSFITALCLMFKVISNVFFGDV